MRVRETLGRHARNLLNQLTARSGFVRIARFQFGIGSVGRGGSVADEKTLAGLRLGAPKRALPRTENPRVGGSIPPLATTPNSLKRNGFPASPADYRLRGGAEKRPTIGLSEIGSVARATTRCGRRSGELETWNPGDARRGAGRVDAARRCPECPRGAHSGGGPWPPPWPGGARPSRARDATSEEARAVLAKASTV